MKEFFKNVNIVKTITASVLIILGLCLICLPNATLLTLCYLTGGIILFFGICSIVNYFLYGVEPFGFMGGVIALAIGGLIIGLAPQITSAQIFSLTVGIVMLLNGLLKIQNSMDYRRFGVKNWWIYMIYATILVVFSIVLLVNPFHGQRILLIFLGVVLLVDGIFKLITIFLIKNKIKNLKSKNEENIIDI